MHNVQENVFLHKFTDEFSIQVYVVVNTILLNIVQYFGRYIRDYEHADMSKNLSM